MTIDTTNKFIVSSNGREIQVINPPIMPLSKADALNLAAYLVVLSMATEDEWHETLEAIENT